MKKEKILFKDRIKRNHLDIVIGIFLCLFSVMGMVNYTYFAQFFTYIISFFVGTVAAYFVYLLIFLKGISLIISKKYKLKFSFILFGLIFIFIGIMIIYTNSCFSDGDKYITFSGYGINGVKFDPVVDENGNYIFGFSFGEGFEFCYKQFPEVTFVSKDVGVIGLTLTCLINSTMSNIGSYVFGGVFIALGTVFVLLKLIIQFSTFLYGYSKKIILQKKNQVYKDSKDAEIDDYEVFNNQDIKNEEIVNEKKEVVNNIDIEKNNSIKEESNSDVLLEDNDEIIENEDNGTLKELSFDDIIKKNTNTNPKKEVGNNIVIKDNKEDNDVNNAKTISEETLESKVIDEVNNNEVVNDNNDENSELDIQENKNSDENTMFLEQNEEENEEEIFSEQINVVENINNNIEKDKADEEDEEEVVNLTEPNNEEDDSNDDVDEKIEQETKQKETKPKKEKPKNYVLANSDVLKDIETGEVDNENDMLATNNVALLNNALAEFKLGLKVVGYKIGPSVTRYEVIANAGVSVNSVTKYLDDLSRKMNGQSIRFIPYQEGASSCFFEIANKKSTPVSFKSVFEALPKLSKEKYYGLYIPFGKDINGDLVCEKFNKFPHLLVCGTTGSGKSVFMHSLLVTLIMRNTPNELKLIIVDPKVTEFSKYHDIPHLLCPIITDSNVACNVLNKLVDLMNERYTFLSKNEVTDIDEYNSEYAKVNNLPKLPYIIAILDEYSDLVEGNKNISAKVLSLAQKARACGIHILIATQAPRTAIITGVIKANMPTRVALLCASATDSMNILQEGGAEKLLGNGDMLVQSPLFKSKGIMRVQGAFIQNSEIKAVCNYYRERYSSEYDPEFTELTDPSNKDNVNYNVKTSNNNAVYSQIKLFAMSLDFISISKIQRQFNCSFNNASNYFNMLKQDGIISSEETTTSGKGTKVLVHEMTGEDNGKTTSYSYEQSTFNKF